MDILKRFGDAVGRIYQQGSQAVSSFANTINQNYQQSLARQQQQRAQAQQVRAQVLNYMDTTLRNASQSIQQNNPFKGLTPQKIVSSLIEAQPIVKDFRRMQQSKSPIDYIANTPLINTANYGGYQIKSPTIGGYISGQVVKPISEGAGSIMNEPDWRMKGIGGLQIAGGVLSATPPGLVWNLATGGIAGAAKTVRTGDWNNMDANIKTAIESPTSIAHEGLGVEQPILALGIDLLITRNPKSLVKSLKSGKGFAAAIKEVSDDQAVTKAVKTSMAKPDAQKKLKSLLTYENELAKRGFTAQQRAQYSAEKARELFQWDSATADKVVGEALYYAEQKKSVFNDLFKRFIGEQDVARTTGVQFGMKYKTIPENIGWDVIKAMEHPTRNVANKVKMFANQLRKEYDALYKEANKAGLDTNYLRNYITHIWKEPPAQVEQVMRAAGQKFRFSKERFIPTYEAGMAAGLTPKFTHPAEIIAEYVRRMEMTKSNVKFLEALKKEGLVVDAAVGSGRPGFTAITAPGFPVSMSKDYTGTVVRGHYFAPAEIAKVINKVFEEQTGNAILNVTANVSRKMQDLRLSGGIPFTPLNAFSYTAGLQPEVLAGRFRSPVAAMARATFTNGQEYFMSKIETIKEMQLRNIPLNTNLTVDDIVDRGKLKNALGLKGFDDTWDKAFNDKTFQQFFPMLQIQFYEDVKNAAMKGTWFRKKHNAEDAADIAAKATKNWFGLITTDRMARANKTTEDFRSTVLFAPKFREQMINKWINTVKAASPIHIKDKRLALNNPLSYENEYNTRFLVGAVINYMLFDKANYMVWGRHLAENPSGNEDYLLMPLGDIGNDGKQDVVRIPYLSSIGTLPRLAYKGVKHALEGDSAGLVQDVKSIASIPLQIGSSVVTNQDYFGDPIRDTEAPAGEQFRDVGSYLYEQASHPFMSALNEQGIGLAPRPEDKQPPLYQSIARAIELPIKFTTTEKLQSAFYYTVRDEFLKELSADEKEVFETLLQPSDGTYQQRMSEAQLRLAHPNVLKAETMIARETAERTNEPVRPFYQLPSQFQRTILQYQALPPGQDRSAIIKNNISWLQEYYKAEEDYWQQFNQKHPDKAKPADDGVRASNEIQQKIDTYYSLPYGTGQRSQYATSNPDLVQYWNDKAAENNAIRASLGLSPLENFNSGFGRTSSRSSFKPFNRYAGLRKKKITGGKKISLKLPKIKKPKKQKPIEALKFKPLKMPKVPKYA